VVDSGLDSPTAKGGEWRSEFDAAFTELLWLLVNFFLHF